LIAATLAAFLLSLVIWLPASLLAHWLPSSVTTGPLYGTVWNGSTDTVTVEGHALGALQWHLQALPLLTGHAAVDIDLRSATGGAHGSMNFGFGGSVAAHEFEVHWPLSALPPNLAPPRWNGELQAHIQDLAFDGSKVTQILGTVDTRNLQTPPPDSASLGDFRMTFDEKSAQGDHWVGRLQDLGGPMPLTGTLTLGPKSEYVIEGLVAARADAADAITQTLRFLGAPDAQGRRPFSIAGTY